MVVYYVIRTLFWFVAVAAVAVAATIWAIGKQSR